MALIQAKCWKAMKTMKNWKIMLLEPNELLWIAPLRWTLLHYLIREKKISQHFKLKILVIFFALGNKFSYQNVARKLVFKPRYVLSWYLIRDKYHIADTTAYPCTIKWLPYWNTVDFLGFVVFKLIILVRNLKKTQE